MIRPTFSQSRSSIEKWTDQLPKTCAKAIIERLASHGIDTVFGIPGVHTLELYRALGASPLRHVATRHEQGAAFMADGFARACGRPAMCALISGPGFLNAATAIGQAYSDSIPMVVLTTVNSREDIGLGRGDLHEMRSQRRAAEGLMSSVFSLASASQGDTAVDLSMARLKLARPRPVYIEIPLDIAAEPVPDNAQGIGELWRAAPHPAPLAQAVALLDTAERALMIVGGGAIDAAPSIRALSARLKIPVISTVAGKGIVPEDSSLAAGARLATASGRKLLAAADVIVAIGTELAPTDHWADHLRFNGKLIRIDIDPDTLVRDHMPQVALLADAAETCGQLDAALASRSRETCWAGDLAEIRLVEELELRKTRGPHLEALHALRRALPGDAVVVTDMTQLAYAGNQAFATYEPRSWIHPVGFGTLGYALPAAIGAKLARPDKPVVAIAGDYGFGFTAQELGTAVDQGLGLPVVIWNNRGLGQIQKDMDLGDIKRIGVDIAPPDFAALARSFGCRHRKIVEIGDIAEAVEAALAGIRPTIIEIETA